MIKIERLTKSPFTDLYKIYLDNGLDLPISANTIAKYTLFKGRVITEAELPELQKDSIYDKLYEYAIRSLQLKSRTSIELKRKLHEKLSSAYMFGKFKSESPVPKYELDKIIDKIISKLNNKKLLNDEEFAKTYIETRIHSRKSPSTRDLFNKLKQKGITDETLQQFKQEYEENDEANLINAARQKYTRLLARESDPKKLKQKLYMFLVSKGFKINIPIEDLILSISRED